MHTNDFLEKKNPTPQSNKHNFITLPDSIACGLPKFLNIRFHGYSQLPIRTTTQEQPNQGTCLSAASLPAALNVSPAEAGTKQ